MQFITDKALLKPNEYVLINTQIDGYIFTNVGDKDIQVYHSDNGLDWEYLYDISSETPQWHEPTKPYIKTTGQLYIYADLPDAFSSNPVVTQPTNLNFVTPDELQQATSLLSNRMQMNEIVDIEQGNFINDLKASDTIINNQITALNQFMNKPTWKVISTVTDLNTLTEQGNYFIQATGNTNAPTTGWIYVVVNKATNDRIIQSVWGDGNSQLRYARVFNGAWRAWEKFITLNELNHRLNTLYVGGRNLILKSQQAIQGSGQHTQTFELSQNIDYSTVRQLTLSCDISYTNAVKATQAGAKWFRMGIEVFVRFTDNTTQWLTCWKTATDTPTSFNGRMVSRLAVPSNKTIRNLEATKTQIFDVTGTNITVKNPKLELGLVQTDWSPAPEDFLSTNSNSIGD